MLHLFFLFPISAGAWSWFCGIGGTSLASHRPNAIWIAILGNSCHYSQLAFGALMGIMLHSVWKARSRHLHCHLGVSSAAICSAFIDEASLSLSRFSKPFRNASLAGFFHSLKVDLPGALDRRSDARLR